MPGTEKTALAIAGAVLGVLGTLVTLLLLVGQADAHFVTRREYEATLVAIHGQLESIQATVSKDRSARKADR